MPPPLPDLMDPMTYRRAFEKFNIPFEHHQDMDGDADATSSADTPMADDHEILPSTITAAIEHNRAAPSPVTFSSKINIDLASMSAKKRDDLYSKLFERDIPIEQINVPALAEKYPELKDEIVTAYTSYSTFILHIIINYDAASGLFFTDTRRYNDCGRLNISPKSLARLRNLDTHSIVYNNVRLDISTHFRTLARITVKVRPSKLNVGPQIDVFINKLKCPLDIYDHELVHDFITKQAETIQDPEKDFTDGKNGFTFADLGEVAKLFAPLPSGMEAMRRNWMGYNGVWEGRGRNTGYMEGLS